jgi:hypothetical protein
MGFRFHKSLSLLPGLRLNLSKSGPSVSVGGKGLSYNIGPKGSRQTVGLPGSGISYSETSRSATGKQGSWFGIAALIAAVAYAVYKNFG